MTRRPLTAESGFTLLELLVALTLATVISLCISTVGTQAQKIYDVTTSKVDVYQKFRYALDDMEETVRGWEATTSLEYYVDVSQPTSAIGKNGHWDEGEEVAIKGPNLDGGMYLEYDEGAKIFERKYTLERGPLTSEHSAYKFYFRGPAEVDGFTRLANIEYLLADPSEIEQDGRINPIPDVVDDNSNFVLLRVVRYIDVNSENYDRATNEVKQTVTELCANVTDFQVEYFYDNIFDDEPGAFCTPSTEPLLIDTEVRPKELDDGTFVKEFLYGGFNDLTRASAARGRRAAATGVDEPVYFQALGGSTENRFSQLSLGDPIYIWSDANAKFPPGDYTVRRNVNGKLYFQEPVDSTEWDADQGNLRFRAAYVPSSVRISIRVLNDEGREPRTLSITVHPYHATM